MSERLLSRLVWLILFLGVSCFINSSFAQPRPLAQYSEQQKLQQINLQKTLTRFEQVNYQQALTEARRQNRPIIQRHPDGRITILSGITEWGELLYKSTLSNTRAGITTRTNSLYAGGSLGLSLSGSTLLNKLAIWDGGKVRSTHVEFRNANGSSRVVQVDNPDTLTDLHATHVAGTMIAAGVNPLARGMAYATNLQAYDLDNDLSEMSSAAPNLLLSNHSYGAIAGWFYNDSRTTTTKWEWRGDTTISRTEDYKFGLYEADSRAWDQVAYNSPYYLIVKAAGNAHDAARPAAGESYYLPNHRNAISTLPRNNQDGYDQIPTNSTAKNILSVAAVASISNGYNQPSDIKLAYFSSWGPTDDGRIKPDISGVGLAVLSSVSTTDNSYAVEQGTSMAAPNVSGSLLLLQEYYAQLNPGKFMRSSTLRGLVLHTADEAGDAPGPDYRFGWGLLNMERAARIIGNTDKTNLLEERTLTQGSSYSATVVASGKGPLTASICWTDPAGTVVNPRTGPVNDRTPKLVNDLDIRVSDGRTASLPWVLDPNNPANAATRGDNIRDNIEQVLIANPRPGQTYTITVTHKKDSLSTGKQDYALIVSGAGGTAYCASAPTSNADTKISRVQLGSINQAGAEGCTTYTDFTSVSTSVQSGQQLPLTVSLGSCGAVRNVVVKAFADWNQNGSFDDAGETLATSDVLPNSGQFTATVTIPESLQKQQFIRLRIVATETSNAGAVVSCGNYSNGETQDYVLNVVQTVNDVGAAELVSPTASFCSQTGTDVAVRVRNYGSADQVNVPVSVRIVGPNNAEVTTLSGIVPRVPAFGSSLLTLRTPSSTSLVSGQTYQFIISTGLTTDQVVTNNTITVSRATAADPVNGLFSALRCGSDSAVSLRNTGSGVAFWYDALSGGNLLAIGNQTSVRSVPTNGQYYVALNTFSGIIGPVDKKAFGGGSYNTGLTTAPLISTKVPLLIESARLYIGSAGQLTFTVRKLDNTAISSVTLDVTPTRNQSASITAGGVYPDDPDDPGAIYPLNLRIPDGGDYKITLDYADGSSIFRSNSAVTGFPYQLTTQSGEPLVTIRGALFNNPTTNKVDTLTTAWYYFYNLRVRSLECASAQRVAVAPTTGTAPTATVTANGSTSVCQGASLTLQANTGTGFTYQWYANGQLVPGATSSTLQVATAGNYAVQISNGCLPVRSAAVAVSVRSAQPTTITATGFVLSTNATQNIQWLLDGVPISGANSTTYTVSTSGRYSVRGSVNGCGESVSDEIYLTILANEPSSTDLSMGVYPNPVTRQLTVSLSGVPALKSLPTVRLTDLRGAILQTTTLQRDGKAYSTVIDVGNLPAGIFLVVVEDEPTKNVWVKRIRKQ